MTSEVSTLVRFQQFTARAFCRIDGKYEADPDKLSLASLVHAALGICGELGEFMACAEADEQNVEALIEEAGDVLSYVFLASAVLGLDVATWSSEDVLEQPELLLGMSCVTVEERLRAIGYTIRAALSFAEIAKKLVYQGREISVSEGDQVLRHVFHGVARYMASADHSVVDIIQANIRKLEARYPEAI